jgi:hypothetical protein
MSVVKGLPAELKMDKVSLPDSVSSYFVKVAPQNVTSVTSQSYAINSTNVAAAGYRAVNSPSTQINFDIPAGQKGTYIDVDQSTISFRVKYSRADGATKLSDGILNRVQLVHNAFNFFQRIFHTSATGTILDDVPNVNLAYTNWLQQNISAQEMDSLALPFGFNAETPVDASGSSNANTGHAITGIANGTASTTTSVYYSYEVPLPSSLIGRFASQMFPIGDLQKLTLSLVTADVTPVVLYLNAAATGSADFSTTIDNISINLKYVSLGEQASALLGGNGMKICSGITHRVSSSTVAASTSGAVSILLGNRGSSVRSLTTRCVDLSTSGPTTGGSVNLIYDSKLIPATSLNYFISGVQRCPPNPLDPCRMPASVYMRVLHAANSWSERQFKFSGTPQSFCIYPAGVSLPSDKDNYLASSASEQKSLATFMFAMNLQKVSKSKILDGMNMNGASSFLEMNLVGGNTNSLTFYTISEQDILFIIDPSTGDIQVRS